MVTKIKKTIIKLFLLIITLIFAGLSLIALFYPDYSRNNDENYFVSTIMLEMVQQNGNKIEDFNKNALAKEAMANAINEINPYFLTRRLNEIGYDSIINLKETAKGIHLSNKQQHLTITITSFDGEYVEKMSNQLVLKLTQYSGSAPYYRLIVNEPVKIERKPTSATFFDRQIGEEITVGVFVVLWIGVLGVILMREIKRSEKNHGGK